MIKNHFHRRIFISISLFIAGVTLFCVVFLSAYTYHRMEQQSQQNLDQLCESTAAEFNSLINEMNKLALYASTNRTVMDVFMDNHSRDASERVINQEIYDVLNALSTPNSSNRFRITLYSPDGLFFSTGTPYERRYVTEKTESTSFKQWYDALPITSNDYSIEAFHRDYWTGDDTLYLSLFRQIFDPYLITDSNGIVEVQCSFDEVMDLFTFQDSQYEGILSDSGGKVLLASKGGGALTDDLLFGTCTLDNGFQVTVTQSRSHIWNVILPQIAVIVLMGAALLVVMLFAVFAITRRSTEPLRKLTAKIRQVSVDTPSLHLNGLDYPDEIYSMNQAFDQMFERIHAFTNEIIAVRTNEMRAHMIALQAQMNPHFLYNMLSVIKIMSQEGNNAQIESACDYLVKMLRYTSTYDRADVTLEEEFTHVSCYLSLMKMRYEDYLSCTVDSVPDQSGAPFTLPRLTLLPLLENSFKHGFQGAAPPWNITVSCTYDDTMVQIRVRDNGCGIAEKKKEEIRTGLEELLKNPDSKIASLSFGGTGLINTLARLTLKYKENFHYEIITPPDGGTEIILEVKQ